MKLFFRWSVFVVGALTSTAGISNAQTVYGVDSGRTSITLDTNTVEKLGYVVTGTNGTVEALQGLAYGFSILDESSDFSFTLAEAGGVAVQAGILNHSGWIELDDDGDPENGFIKLGNFEIGVDPGRESETVSGAYVRDTLGTNVVVFDIKPTGENEVNPVSDGETLTLQTSDLLVSPELYALLGSPAGVSPGDFVGSIRVDASVSSTAIPEPSTGILWLCGFALVCFSRRRG